VTVGATVGVTGPWAALRAELDRWAMAGRTATLWWRDDDACTATPALGRLLAIAGAHRVPVTLAVIPARAEPALIRAIDACDAATVVQHGYAHANHAAAGERNQELGEHRPVASCLDELGRGRARLAAMAGARFLPVLVPPWNRIASAVTAALPAGGFAGLSTFGPRPRPFVAAGLVQCNTHVDVVAWRRGRQFVGDAAALERLTDHLAARRAGRVDGDEPTGLLTHHLVADPATWLFVESLLMRTQRHPAAEWLGADALFG
jgi:hypothetical protein